MPPYNGGIWTSIQCSTWMLMMPCIATTTMSTQRLTGVHMHGNHSSSLWFHCWDHWVLFTASYHIYHNIWEASVGQTLLCQWETGSPHNTYAVLVKKRVILYVPRPCYMIYWSDIANLPPEHGKVGYAWLEWLLPSTSYCFFPSLTHFCSLWKGLDTQLGKEYIRHLSQALSTVVGWLLWTIKHANKSSYYQL